MLVSQPPYALGITTFRFAALAALAGRAAIGGQREVALATYLAARLADDTRPARALSPTTRTERAASARTWMSNLALPSAVRPALVRLVESSAGNPTDTARALRTLIGVTAGILDAGAQSELERLATALEQE